MPAIIAIIAIISALAAAPVGVCLRVINAALQRLHVCSSDLARLPQEPAERTNGLVVVARAGACRTGELFDHRAHRATALYAVVA
jgi:hypothetical protein